MLWMAFYLMVQSSFPLVYNVLYASHWTLFLTTASSAYNAFASLEITRPIFKKYERLRLGYLLFTLAFTLNVMSSIAFWVFLKDDLLNGHEMYYQKALFVIIHSLPTFYCIIEAMISRVAFYEDYFVHCFVILVLYFFITLVAAVDDSVVIYSSLKWESGMKAINQKSLKYDSMGDFYKVGLFFITFTLFYYAACKITKHRIAFALKDPNINLL